MSNQIYLKSYDKYITVSKEYWVYDFDKHMNTTGAGRYLVKLTNKTKVSINNPGKLICLMLNAKGDWANYGGELLDAFNDYAKAEKRKEERKKRQESGKDHWLFKLGDVLADVDDAAKTSYKIDEKMNSHVHSTHNSIIGDIENMYQTIFEDYKKFGYMSSSLVKKKINNFKEAVNDLKKYDCSITASHKASASELYDLKFFRPLESINEMRAAIAYYDNIGSPITPLAKEFRDWWTKNVIDYIMQNVAS